MDTAQRLVESIQSIRETALEKVQNSTYRKPTMPYNNPPALSFTFNRLEGKVILVTGASSGIGEAASKLFAREGATVIAVARRKTRLDALVKDLTAQGLKAEAMECDVNKEEAVQLTVEAIVEKHGTLDGAFNNAGVGLGKARVPLHEAKLADYDRVLETNLRAVFICMKYELEAMLKTGGGSIVNCSSIGGLAGAPGNSIYAASKFGMTGLIRCAALDYAQQNIRVNGVAPGPTNSEMLDSWLDTEEARAKIAGLFPMNYVAEPDDVARAVLFLLSEESRWTTGHVFPVEGGKAA